MFKEGKSFSNFPVRVLYLFANGGTGTLQAGFTVSSKNFKKAIDRNKIKRLMKEAYRLQKNPLAEKLLSQNKFMVSFFIYSGHTMPGYPDIFVKITSGLKRLEKVIDENIASAS